MSTPSTIRVEMQHGLAVVNLAQAARGNPIDGDFALDFKQLAADLWDAPGLRGVLLRADGANYSYGGDLKSFFPLRDCPLDERVMPLQSEVQLDFLRCPEQWPASHEGRSGELLAAHCHHERERPVRPG